MGLLSDILKEIPQAAVLKEKIADIEAKYAASDTENAILKDDLRHAKAEIEKLNHKIEELTGKDDLNEVEILILTDLAQFGSRAHVVFVDSLTEQLDLHIERARYHLRRLVDMEYIQFFQGTPSMPDQYRLGQKGRERLIREGLIN